MSKGSNRRPCDEGKVRSNWDTVFGKPVKEVEQKELFLKEKDKDELRTKATGPTQR
jgi:hypothetical protein